MDLTAVSCTLNDCIEVFTLDYLTLVQHYKCKFRDFFVMLGYKEDIAYEKCQLSSSHMLKCVNILSDSKL